MEPASYAATAERSARRFASLRVVIGDTPLIVVRCRFRGRETRVHAKYEIRNLTGSIKDRMVLRLLEDGYERGDLAPGDVLTEASSGNTGIALAAIGRALGHDVRIYMPDWMSRERVLLLRSLGATVVPVSAQAGGFLGCIALSQAHAREHERVWLPRQFESDANVQAHERTTGPELLAQIRAQGREPTAFVAGVGTGGTVMGVGRCLRAAVPGVRVHPLEPANSPTLRTGQRVGQHRIQGISDEFVPPVVHLAELDEIVDVWDGDAILMAQKLARELGLGVGISSGANFLGALSVVDAQGADAVVGTVFPDSNKKYLSTDLLAQEPVRDGYLTPQVEILGCEVVPPARAL